ncbi:hypothetical protein OJAV_G00143460 [Oryzias javanicus]|uniref:Uncharacterized protein n=1 Tax=Oryzias javanicus TaxID=123683 RepID=A0A437CMT4_ORYJA|nr:hypothetical protein OJAV_G00143460 [Oryzias javanicus]
MFGGEAAGRNTNRVCMGKELAPTEIHTSGGEPSKETRTRQERPKRSRRGRRDLQASLDSVQVRGQDPETWRTHICL